MSHAKTRLMSTILLALVTLTAPFATFGGAAQAGVFGQGDGSDLGPDPVLRGGRSARSSGTVGRTLTTAQIVGGSLPHWKRARRNADRRLAELRGQYQQLRRAHDATRDWNQKRYYQAQAQRVLRQGYALQAKRQRAQLIVSRWSRPTTVNYYYGANAGRFPVARSLEQIKAQVRGNLALLGTTLYFRSGW